jgi:endo-1,4-beta-xylanase
MGGGTGTTWQWIINAFLWAREACPNAVLMMNDYNNIELADQNAHFIDIVKVIRAAGAPIDAVGAEAHGVTMSTATFSTVQTLLEKLHTETGLPVYITEFDFGASDDAKQLAYYQQYFSLFHNASYVEGITLWGWVDGQTWVSNSGLVKGTTPRPAMTWLMNYLGRPAPP